MSSSSTKRIWYGSSRNTSTTTTLRVLTSLWITTLHFPGSSNLLKMAQSLPNRSSVDCIIVTGALLEKDNQSVTVTFHSMAISCAVARISFVGHAAIANWTVNQPPFKNTEIQLSIANPLIDAPDVVFAMDNRSLTMNVWSSSSEIAPEQRWGVVPANFQALSIHT